MEDHGLVHLHLAMVTLTFKAVIGYIQTMILFLELMLAKQVPVAASPPSLEEKSNPTVVSSPVSQPPPPQPMLGNGPRIAPNVDYKLAVEVKQEEVPLEEPAPKTTAPQSQAVKPAKIAEKENSEKIPPAQEIIPAFQEEPNSKDDGQEEPKNNSLFDRLFKKGSE